MTADDHAIVGEFSRLLDAEDNEQAYQAFLEKHSRFIPREFVQNHGVHFSIVFRKLRLGENYTTDFFYLAKSSGDWNAVFVEIEKPSSKFFKEGTDSFSPDFSAGLQQINAWRAWTSNTANLQHLVSETLEPIWQPPAMRSNPIYPQFVLVTGRRAELAGDDRKRALVRSQERPDFKILTYDSLLDGYSFNGPLYVAVRSNSHIEIQGDHFVGESIFAWAEPSRLSISQALYDDAIAHRDSWRYGLDPKTLEKTLPKVKIRSSPKVAATTPQVDEVADAKTEVIPQLEMQPETTGTT